MTNFAALPRLQIREHTAESPALRGRDSDGQQTGAALPSLPLHRKSDQDGQGQGGGQGQSGQGQGGSSGAGGARRLTRSGEGFAPITGTRAATGLASSFERGNGSISNPHGWNERFNPRNFGRPLSVQGSNPEWSRQVSAGQTFAQHQVRPVNLLAEQRVTIPVRV